MTAKIRAEDELACARLMLRASYYADMHRIDDFVGLFARDGWLELRGDRFNGPMAIRGFMEKRKRERVTRHVLAPPLIELTPSEEGSGVAFFTLFDAIQGDGQVEFTMALPASVGEFRQTYRRDNGAWAITSHIAIITFRRG